MSRLSLLVSASVWAVFIAVQAVASPVPADQVILASAYGMRCDGRTDDGPALQRAEDAIRPSGPTWIQLPQGQCRIASPVTIRTAGTTAGYGWTETAAYGRETAGTSLLLDTVGISPITYLGNLATGSVLRDLAFAERQPAPGAGWSPVDYAPVISILHTHGGIFLDNIFLSGVTRGIYARDGGRIHVGNLSGQVFVYGLDYDDQYDICRVDHLHLWPFWSQDSNVLAFTVAHADAIASGRTDGLSIDDAFAFGMRSLLHLRNGRNGVTTAYQIDRLYADSAQYAVWIESSATSGQISQIVSTGQSFGHPADRTVPIIGSTGISIDGDKNELDVGQLRVDNPDLGALSVSGAGNQINVDQLRIHNLNVWKQAGQAPSSVISIRNAGGAGRNLVRLGQTPFQTGTGMLVDPDARQDVTTPTYR